jgi:hypothetical protein
MWMAEVGVDFPSSMEHCNPMRANGRLFSVLAKERRKGLALPFHSKQEHDKNAN